MTEEPTGVVRLLGIRDAALTIDEVYAAVTDPGAGGVALFVGTVRAVDHDHAVEQLSYSAHPSVDVELARVADAVAARHDLIALAAVHRVCDLAVGDIAVVVATSAAHRGPALAACRELIDELKASVPIWKHQLFGDGTEEWVGSP